MSHYSNGPATIGFHPVVVSEEAPPTANVYTTLLATTSNVRIWYIYAIQANTEAAAKTVNINLIIDGNTYTTAQAMNSGTGYYLARSMTTNTLAWVTGQDTTGCASNTYHAIPLCGKSVMIQIRQTTAVGTNQTLKAYLMYDTME